MIFLRRSSKTGPKKKSKIIWIIEARLDLLSFIQDTNFDREQSSKDINSKAFDLEGKVYYLCIINCIKPFFV